MILNRWDFVELALSDMRKAKRKQKGKSKARMKAKKREAIKQAGGTGP